MQPCSVECAQTSCDSSHNALILLAMPGSGTTGTDAQHRLRRLEWRIRLTILSIIAVLLIGVAGMLVAGRQLADKELTTIRNGDRIWALCDQQFNQFNPAAAPCNTKVQAYRAYRRQIPVNPYNGKLCVENGSTANLAPGDFSYLLAVNNNYVADFVVIVYSPNPTITQRLYHRFFTRSPFKYEPDLSRPGPNVVWIGGECGNCMIYLSRGMAPKEAIDLLQSRLRRAGLNSADAEDGFVELLTPDEYAIRMK